MSRPFTPPGWGNPSLWPTWAPPSENAATALEGLRFEVERLRDTLLSEDELAGG